MEDYREKARNKLLPKDYSGNFHLLVLFLYCSLLSGYSLYFISADLVIPLHLFAEGNLVKGCLSFMSSMITLSCMCVAGFLYCNLCEYLGHRFPLHQGPRIPKFLYKSHTGLHHHYYNYHHMYPNINRCVAETISQERTDSVDDRHETGHVEEFKSTRVGDDKDWYFTLFPMYTYLFFMTAGALPVYMALCLIPDFPKRDLCTSALLLTGALYLAVYEIAHSFHHKSLPKWLMTSLEGPASGEGLNIIQRFLQRSRRHHKIHHHWRCMHKYNFNITFPVFDIVFGTRFEQDGSHEGREVLAKKEN